MSAQPDLEYGDKVLLPQSSLREITRLGLSLPIIFEILPHGSRAGSSGYRQYCSVMEFTSKELTVYAPNWMMRNLNIKEGGKVTIKSVSFVPRGVYIKIQPHDQAFIRMASTLGPRQLLESCFRGYSVLSTNQCIVIKHNEEVHQVNVLQVKPTDPISLFGDLDLQVEFAPPLIADSEALGSEATRGHEGKDSGGISSAANEHKSASIYEEYKGGDGGSYGSSVSDGKVCSEAESDDLARGRGLLGGDGSHNSNNNRSNKRSIGKFMKKKLEFAFSGKGHVMMEDSGQPRGSSGAEGGARTRLQSDGKDHYMGEEEAKENEEECPQCLSWIPLDNVEIHSIRCSRNERGHKVRCSSCKEAVLKATILDHIHCSHCGVVCSSTTIVAHEQENHSIVMCKCGDTVRSEDLQLHTKSYCSHRLVCCCYCELSFKFQDLKTHEDVCGSRTDVCDVCHKLVKKREMDSHQCVTADSLKLTNSAFFSSSVARGGGGTYANDIPDIDSIRSILADSDIDSFHRLVSHVGAASGSGAGSGSGEVPLHPPFSSVSDKDCIPNPPRGSGSGSGSGNRPPHAPSGSRRPSQRISDLEEEEMMRTAIEASLRESHSSGSESSSSLYSESSGSSRTKRSITSTTDSSEIEAISGSTPRQLSNEATTGNLNFDEDLAAAISASLSLHKQYSNHSELMASLATNDATSEPGKGKGGGREFRCPHCSYVNVDYEELQLHVFTSCTGSGAGADTVDDDSTTISEIHTKSRHPPCPPSTSANYVEPPSFSMERGVDGVQARESSYQQPSKGGALDTKSKHASGSALNALRLKTSTMPSYDSSLSARGRSGNGSGGGGGGAIEPVKPVRLSRVGKAIAAGSAINAIRNQSPRYTPSTALDRFDDDTKCPSSTSAIPISSLAPPLERNKVEKHRRNSAIGRSTVDNIMSSK